MTSSANCDFLSGWIAGMAGLVVGHPIDTLKVRQQILGKPIIQTLLNIERTGGSIISFFRGMGAPLVSTGAMNSIFFGFYGCALDSITDWRKMNSNSLQNSSLRVDHSYWAYLLAGFAGGAAQLIVACPIDLVKVQLQSQIQKNQIKGPIDCIFKIVKAKGVLGLYKGLGIQAARDIPASGFYFVIYEYLKPKLTFNLQKNDSLKLSQFLAGGFAGMLSWWTIIPLDVIKSRIQGESQHERKYRGIVHCSREIFKAYGIRGFFHGFWPLSIRAFPVNGTTFLVYEWLLKSCKEQQAVLYS